ncbi:ciliary-associated calcium-binding coiled-coil protein 1 [Chanos chanos]|uniref:Ciliary-associated calcium-binding coiled-coil protein 1 n=1 Tax=Chanos chanos TaxID=29144 RepID=A0A6J2VDN2_CHACN|nr:ciliary-associated calcium-binding coiled-coil protein 1 [Chanos chanos]
MLEENQAMKMEHLQWERMSYEQINMLLDLPVDQVQLQFEDILQCKLLQEKALLDYFVAGFWWAKDMNFTCQQISFILAVLQLLLDNIKDKQMSFVDNIKEFSQTLLNSTKSLPCKMEANCKLFDENMLKPVIEYFKTSVFQHYRLYEFLFSQARDQQHHGMKRSIETANSASFAAPLEEGMPADVYNRYMVSSTLEQDGTEEMRESHEVTENESKEATKQVDPGYESYSTEDVQEVLGEIAKEMFANLQANFTEKLRIQEEIYTARIEHLKKSSSK